MRYRMVRIGIVTLIALVLSTGLRAEEVDLELVLAVDVSTSIDDNEFTLQRRGYAQAFTNPSVIEAIRSGPNHKIAVAYVEWATTESQVLVVPWTVVSDDESAALLSETILNAPRYLRGWTSISGAIDFSMHVFAESPHTSERRVIDISGDGVNNSGRPATDARDEALADGVTINGLVIMNDIPSPTAYWRPDPPLDEFYRDYVTGGPGAFVVAADGFPAFAQAILNKLIREIAEVPSARQPDFIALDDATWWRHHSSAIALQDWTSSRRRTSPLRRRFPGAGSRSSRP